MVQCNMNPVDNARFARQKSRLSQMLRHCVAMKTCPSSVSILIALGLVAVSVVAPAFASSGSADWPIRLNADLARLGAVELRLREAAGSSCPSLASDAGLVIDDRRAYRQSDWPLLATALGMGDLPVVAGVAPGSPADRAGLRAGDEIAAIGGRSPDAIIAEHKAGALAADALLDQISAAEAGSDLIIEVRRAGQSHSFTLRPIKHCAARLVLFTDRSVEAHSDSRNVAISTGMLGFARTDDELALAAGHELAHVINGDRRGGGMSARRRMEDAADELGFQLAQCAGYEPAKALALFERLGAKDWLGFLRAPTHRSWSDRVARLRALPDPLDCPIVK